MGETATFGSDEGSDESSTKENASDGRAQACVMRVQHAGVLSRFRDKSAMRYTVSGGMGGSTRPAG